MDELTIERLNRGYVVSIETESGVTREWSTERVACNDAYEVLADVLPWLGLDEETTAELLGIVDAAINEVCVLTDKECGEMAGEMTNV